MPLACIVAVAAGLNAQAPAHATTGLTAVEGIKVALHLSERPPAARHSSSTVTHRAAFHSAAARPAICETDLLNPLNMVDKVNAVACRRQRVRSSTPPPVWFAGLEEHNIGWPAGPSRVPIVPAAILFDLGVGGN